MNKSELVDHLAEQMKIAKKQSETIVNLIFDAMTDVLVRGKRIEIRGFGSFVVKDYQGYTGRNPRSGETIEVPPKRLPYFKVGKALKERIDAGSNEAAGAKSTPLAGAADQTGERHDQG